MFEPEKAKSQIVLELMENVVSTIKCEQSPETSCFVSILDFNGLGTIFSCAENEEKAFEIVFDRALTFLTNQMVFFMEFQERMSHLIHFKLPYLLFLINLILL